MRASSHRQFNSYMSICLSSGEKRHRFINQQQPQTKSSHSDSRIQFIPMASIVEYTCNHYHMSNSNKLFMYHNWHYKKYYLLPKQLKHRSTVKRCSHKCIISWYINWNWKFQNENKWINSGGTVDLLRYKLQLMVNGHQ